MAFLVSLTAGAAPTGVLVELGAVTVRPLGALPPRSVHLHPQPYELARGHHRLPVDVDDGRDRAVRDPPIDARLGEGEKARRTSTGDGAAGG